MSSRVKLIGIGVLIVALAGIPRAPAPHVPGPRPSEELVALRRGIEALSRELRAVEELFASRCAELRSLDLPSACDELAEGLAALEVRAATLARDAVASRSNLIDVLGRKVEQPLAGAREELERVEQSGTRVIDLAELYRAMQLRLCRGDRAGALELFAARRGVELEDESPRLVSNLLRAVDATAYHARFSGKSGLRDRRVY